MLESALVAGICSVGADVLKAGIMPTPGVAYLTQRYQFSCGIVISASHNPMEYNGIKFFGPKGFKLPDEVEDEIESLVADQDEIIARPGGGDIGRVYDLNEAKPNYLDFLKNCYRGRQDLTGLTVVIDCANGAASAIGPDVYRAAGAEVIAIHADPDGLNINRDAGSTHMEALVAAVVAEGADAGIAHDGDADRCLAVDASGALVDGDHILAILAGALDRTGALAGHTVVATVMANLGFKIAMRSAGIEVVETAVGDRYVLEAMRDGGFVLGGEQSGHVVMSEFATTGDGLLTGLHLLAEVARTGRPLAELAGAVVKLPQVLVNVSGVDRAGVEGNAVVAEHVARAEAELGESGRVLLRPSGTEPVIRVMVEAASREQAEDVSGRLADVVRAELALS